MPSPVAPSQFDSVVPTPTGSVCDKLVKALIKFPAFFAQFYNWMFDSDATLSSAFLNEIWDAGDYKQSASNSPKKGWLLCDGAIVLRASYPALFSEIGTTFGDGDGSTTFELPNFEDKYAVGAGDTYAGGQEIGANQITIDQTQMPAHKHLIPWMGSFSESDALLRVDDSATTPTTTTPTSTPTTTATTTTLAPGPTGTNATNPTHDGNQIHSPIYGYVNCSDLGLTFSGDGNVRVLNDSGDRNYPADSSSSARRAILPYTSLQGNDNPASDPIDITPRSIAVFWFIKI